jgi:hypothetical protein
MWRRVVCWVATDLSEEHIASIFRVEECTIRPFSGPMTPGLFSYWLGGLVNGCWRLHTDQPMRTKLHFPLTFCFLYTPIFWLAGYSASPAYSLVLAEIISSTLKMEAICSSDTSVATQQTTRRHIPEDYTLHNHRCENLKSYILETFKTFYCVFVFDS